MIFCFFLGVAVGIWVAKPTAAEKAKTLDSASIVRELARQKRS